jgi:serine/threonine-protein kinase
MVGHLPFEGKNPAQVLRRVLEGSYAPADREKPTIGGRWAKILARALAKDAADRYPDAAALTAAIRAELEALEFEDPAAELRAFFFDAETYRAEHASRIVPLLTRRGEKCRKLRDLPGAAADYNRALAYAPQDPTLLRLISRMQRGRAARGAMLTAFSVAAGAVAVGALATFVKSPMTAPKVVLPSQPSQTAASAAEAPSASQAANVPLPVLSGTPRPPPTDRQPRHPPEPGTTPAVPVAVQREVSFVVVPKSALVSIDDGPPEERFMKGTKLSVGSHVFHAQGPPRSKCCKELNQKEEIKPDDGSGIPQQISLSLKFHDARISSTTAPEGAELRCPVLKIAGRASQVYAVPMSSSEQDVTCVIDIAGVSRRESSVTLRAGETTEVPWTSP